MGNMVLIAVRHEALEQLQELSSAHISHAVHKPDNQLKWFDLNKNRLEDKEAEQYSLVSNLLVSHYYHADSGAVFYLNNQMMAYARCLLGAKIAQEDENGLDAHIDTYRFNARQMKLSIVKARKPDYRAELQGPSYSVFGFFTDYMNDLEKNHNLFIDIAHYCKNRELRLRTFSQHGGAGLKALGTFKANQALIVRMSQNMFYKETWPATEFLLTEEESGSVNKTSSLLRKDIDQEFLAREIAIGMGYTAKSKKVRGSD
ncbi:hypothetical protein ACI2KR_09320 [Pseudomonas luteola]